MEKIFFRLTCCCCTFFQCTFTLWPWFSPLHLTASDCAYSYHSIIVGELVLDRLSIESFNFVCGRCDFASSLYAIEASHALVKKPRCFCSPSILIRALKYFPYLDTPSKSVLSSYLINYFFFLFESLLLHTALGKIICRSQESSVWMLDVLQHDSTLQQPSLNACHGSFSYYHCRSLLWTSSHTQCPHSCSSMYIILYIILYLTVFLFLFGSSSFLVMSVLQFDFPVRFWCERWSGGGGDDSRERDLIETERKREERITLI